MFLETIEIVGFRSCDSAQIHFDPHLTVLVGENNGGKSNIIEAVRLLTSPSDGRRTRYPEPDDLRFTRAESFFTIRGRYRGLTAEQQGHHLVAADDADGGIAHRLRFDLPNSGQRRGSSTWTVGVNETPDPEPAAREQIRHVYLPPLRDAESALSSGAGDRIEFVLRTLGDDEEVEGFEAEAAAAFDNLEQHDLIQRMDTAVSTHLLSLTEGVRPQASRLGFVDPTLRRLAKTMRMRLAAAGFDPADLSHSGMGYSNLLYIATVIVELAATTDAHLTVFLVEEPEAHLHPQLQALVLAFLVEEAKALPPGTTSVQVIVTTHSSQIASSVPSKHVEVLKLVETGGEHQEADQAGEGEEVADVDVGAATRAVPVWHLDLAPAVRRKVDRYLNATRAPLMFGPRALLVEGIAEAILLPVMADLILEDVKAKHRFRSTPIIAIEGVDFEPYVRLLLTQYEGVCIADRLVVVTDGDPAAPGDRVAALENLGLALGSPGVLTVKHAPITLEASLMEAGNDACLRAAFLDQRPTLEADWVAQVEGVPATERPIAVVELIATKRLRKGDLAQSIAAWSTLPQSELAVPQYLRETIEAVAGP